MSASRFSRGRGTPKGAEAVGGEQSFSAPSTSTPPPEAAPTDEEMALLSASSAANPGLPPPSSAQPPSRLQTPTSSRRTSPRAPQSEPPAELLEHHRAVRESPRTTETEHAPASAPPLASRENSRHLQLVDHPSQSSLNDRAGGPAGEHRVQIVTPHSRRQVPTLQLGGSSSRLDSPRDGEGEGQAEAAADAGGDDAAAAAASSEKQSLTGHSSAKVIKQDVRGQLDRMERLRQLHHTCCFSLLHNSLCFFGLGYNIMDFPRTKTFSDANKGLDLRRDAVGLSVSVIVREIETFKTHITGLIKPLVRIHAVAMDTGLYINSIDKRPTPPAVTQAELSTQCGSKAVWDQEVILDAHFYDIATENTLLLFEILDDKPSLSLDKHTRSKHCYFKKIAWGFLLPVGSNGQMHVGFGSRQAIGGAEKVGHTPRVGAAATSARPGKESKPKASPKAPPNRPFHQPLRVQLFRYRRYDGVVGFLQRSILAWPAIDPRYLSIEDPAFPHAVPSVYLQWRLLHRLPIEGAFLDVSIGPKVMRVRTPRAEATGDRGEGDSTEGSMSPRSPVPHEEELSSLYERLSHKKKKRAKSKDEANKLRSTALRRVRKADEPCAIPERFLRKLDVGPDGAMMVAFSHSGHLLAIAAKYDTQSAPLFAQDIVYSLILYDTDTDEEVWSEYIAHHSVIYDIKWSKNDRYLLTAAGDGTCKVWDLLYFSPLLEVIERSRSAATTMEDNTLHNAQSTLLDDRPGERGRVPSPPLSPGPLTPSPPVITKNGILASHPPRIIQVLSLGTAAYAYCAVFQEFHSANIQNTLQLLHNLSNPLPGSMLGWPTLVEQFQAIKNADVPRVIVGCADGRLRVYENNCFAGFLSVPSDESAEATSRQDMSPHDAQINALVIDERSKYLISGDANGDVFAWRLDRAGWYQILRKFKRNPPPNSVANPLFNAQTAMLEHFDNGSVLTMMTHPNKNKSMLLVHSRQPATLKVISLTTYKPISYCEGYTGIPQSYLVREDNQIFSAGIFFKAMFSADGRYTISCNAQQGASTMDARHSSSPEMGSYRLLVWDTYTGHLVQTPLSSLSFPYPVRAIAWHPCQHLMAVTMVGEGAAVVLYCADADSSLKLLDRKAELQSGAAAAIATMVPPAAAATDLSQSAVRASRDKPLQNTSALPSPLPMRSSLAQDELNYSLLDNSAFIQGKAAGLDASAHVLMGTRSDAPPSMATRPLASSSAAGSDLDREERLNRAKEMLDRIRNSRAKGADGQT